MNKKKSEALDPRLAHSCGILSRFLWHEAAISIISTSSGRDASPSQVTSPQFVRFPQQFAGTHLYTWVERGTVRVKCLAQDTHFSRIAAKLGQYRKQCVGSSTGASQREHAGDRHQFFCNSFRSAKQGEIRCRAHRNKAVSLTNPYFNRKTFERNC